MSNRGKNNHYHYAEKFEPRDRYQRGRRTVFRLPVKSVIFSLIVLLMFGLISTTFAVYITENPPAMEEGAAPLAVSVRNLRASREVFTANGKADLAGSGAEMDIADSGATWSFSGGYLYFEKPSTWTTNISSIQLVIGKDSYSSCYSMSKVTNTNYYVVALPTSGWGDATYMAVIGNSSAWNSGNWGSSNISNASNKTSIYTSGLSSSSDQRYLFDGSLTYLGTGNDSLKLVTLSATAYYSTNGSSYTSGDTGGTIKIKSYYFNAYNSVTSSETSASGSDSYSAAKATANSTFTATAKTGYVFVGWFTTTSGGSAVSTSATYNYQTTSGDKTLYARFIARRTVTVGTKNPSTYTGSPYVNTAGTTSVTVNAGTSVTYYADLKTGVTVKWYTTSSGSTVASSAASFSVTPTTANITRYPRYTLASPTSLSLSYTTKTLPSGGGSVTSSPTKSATSAAGSDGSLSYSYSITTASGTTATEGTDYSINASTGVVTASKPGKYTVTMTVTDTAYGLTSASATTTATVTIKPAAPSAIRFTVSGYTDTTSSTTGQTYNEPYKIPVDNGSPITSDFTVRTLIPEENREEDYIYRWTMTEGTFNASNGTLTNGSLGNAVYGSTTVSVEDFNDHVDGSGTTPTTGSGTRLHVSSNGYYFYKASLIARCNGVDSAAFTATLYYNVISNFLQVTQYNFGDTQDKFDVHKIYATGNDISEITADYRAGGTEFDTVFYFSRDNMTYEPVEIWSTRSSFTVTDEGVSATYTKPVPNVTWNNVKTLVRTFNVANYMPVAGVKYFKSYIADYNTDVGAAKPVLHTTVGTSSSSGNSPLYFVDKTDNTYSNYRLMAFFLDANGQMTYQTGQKMSSRTNTYRFYIPAGATKVAFSYAAENYYVLPTVNGSGFSYTGDSRIYYAWTPVVDLTDSANYGMNTYEAGARHYTTDGNGIKLYSDDHLTTLD